ncbi:MAG TPA: TonB-dependent receptor [Terriglobia bacterium]|nr:TonB-dependent receptor [Terriglobia bacterium]
MVKAHIFLAQMVCCLALAALGVAPAQAQHEQGEIRLKVQDQKGGPLAASVELASEANHVDRTFLTSNAGNYIARELPYGLYRLEVTYPGFVPFNKLVTVQSEVPVTVSVTLGLAPVRSSINVTGSGTLIDPESPRTVYSAGPQALNQQLPAQLGRGLSDVVNSQPGWLYEANGVLHPRGSEYDVQFVVNGLPLTENRSPAFAPPLTQDDVESMRVMTAGFPAEYGRKLGGVVEVTTVKDLPPGFHMRAEADGGSFATAAGGVEMGFAEGANQFLVSGDAGVTDRYLDPPVLANYTNRGSNGAAGATWSRDLTQRDHLRISIRHAETRYTVPNELVQQEDGQRQDTADSETNFQADYSRVLSPTLLFGAEGSLRDESFQLWSNNLSTPVAISQQRGFRQGYGRATLAGSQGIHNWKIGVDTIFNPVRENLQYAITNPSLFDPDTAQSFVFADRQTDIEPAAFAEDTLRLKNWNVSLGMRFDHYGFVVHQSAWSPRVAVSRYFAGLGLLVHADYDRVFQTPAMENLLLASSPAIDQINPLVVRLPVEPARANYYEVGVTKGIQGRVRLDVNVFRRTFRNFADDDTLLNTGVSFPIAVAHATVEGIEGKLAFPHWGRFSGSISYSNQVATGQGPITGGLFIGAEAIADLADNSRFRVSQDQRNSASGNLRYQAASRFWLATETSYGSGLPVELDTGSSDYNFLLAQYGPEILSRVDFARGRVRPSYSVDAGAGFDLYHEEGRTVSLQLQASNLTNHLNVINFASLFSGTAIATPRSYGLRLQASF